MDTINIDSVITQKDNEATRKYGSNIQSTWTRKLVFSLAGLSNKKWIAVFPYDSKGSFGHISLTDGEEVEEVTADKDGWTEVINADGKKGGVPTSHLGKNSGVCNNLAHNYFLLQMIQIKLMLRSSGPSFRMTPKKTLGKSVFRMGRL